MKVGIIGLGLIGGSMAIDLRRKGFASRILGVESDPVNAAAAEKIGLADKVVDFGECVRESDIVILAVPVGAAVKLLPEVLDIFGEILQEYFSALSSDEKPLRIHASDGRYRIFGSVGSHAGPFRRTGLYLLQRGGIRPCGCQEGGEDVRRPEHEADLHERLQS